MTNLWRWCRPLAARTLLVLMLPLALFACTPTVQMAAPKEPITVNLNVKIQHEIYEPAEVKFATNRNNNETIDANSPKMAAE